METYLEQLIDDIRKAAWKVRPPHHLWEESKADPDDELELEDMSFVEQYIYGEEQSIAEITGIEQDQLPLPEQLTEPQQSLLAIELEKLLQLFHFCLDFPETFPAHLRYPFIREFWAGSQVPLSFGENHIEFCSYEENDCPFPGYCNTCKEMAEQMKYDEECGSNRFNDDFDTDNLLLSPEEIDVWMKEQQEFHDDELKMDEIVGRNDDALLPGGFSGGWFDDDGTPINPELIPVPGLCTICKKYQEENAEESLLCLMNRYDQRNNPDFKCGAFEKT